jgi:hypothetical protein
MPNEKAAILKNRVSKPISGHRRFGLACPAPVAFYPLARAAQPSRSPRVVTLPASAQQFFAAVRPNFAALMRYGGTERQCVVG